LDLVRSGGLPRQHSRLGRLHRDDRDVLFVAAQRSGGAVDRVSRAYRVHEGIHAAPGLMPNLLTQRMVACLSIMVIELVSPPVPPAAANLAGGGDHRLD